MTRIAINGLGRIGKLLLRELAAEGALDRVVLLADALGDAAQHAHLIEFDTVHGRFDGAVFSDRDTVTIDGCTLPFVQASSIGELPLARHAVDLVVDCTGAYRTPDALAPYFDADVQRVLVSAPVKDPTHADDRRSTGRRSAPCPLGVE